MSEKKKMDRGRQIELFAKYGNSCEEQIKKIDVECDSVAFLQIINNMFHAVCDFRVQKEDSHDVAALLWAYAQIIAFDASEYLEVLEAHGSLQDFLCGMESEVVGFPSLN